MTYDGLNIGCGSDFIKGWLNIGLFEDKEKFPYSQIVTVNGADILHFDITKGLCIDEPVKYIYSAHMIEHLHIPEGLAFIANCHKALKDDGILRLACPDLGLWIEKYNQKDIGFFERYNELYAGNYIMFRTPGQVFMSLIYMWGHKWMYDFESLRELCLRVGFREAERKSLHKSSIKNIEELESISEMRTRESLYLEAIK